MSEVVHLPQFCHRCQEVATWCSCPSDNGDRSDTRTPSGVVTLSTVKLEQVRWLWPNRLPLGKVVVLDGDPGVGKSTLTLDIAATVSTGRPWPDRAPAPEPSGALLLSAEDGLADTLAPRLAAAGADLTRVHAVTTVPVPTEDGGTRNVPPSLPRDLKVLEQHVRSLNVRLVVVDVLMAYLGGHVDSHRDQDVRSVLHLLADMAQRTGACVVLIRHLNKSSSGSVLYRGGGSIGIIGAARAAYLVARDPDDDQRLVLAVTKMNLAVEPPALAYRLTQDPAYGCARVQWEDAPTDHKAADLLRMPDEDVTERDAAAEWLRGYLTAEGGEAAAKDVKKAGRAAGFAERTIERARARADVVTGRSGFGKGAVYVWRVNP